MAVLKKNVSKHLHSNCHHSELNFLLLICLGLFSLENLKYHRTKWEISKSCEQAHHSGSCQRISSWFGVNIMKTVGGVGQKMAE